MKKLKKLSKNKKPIVIFIYGPIAVGKLTVAKILSKRLKLKLTHNHSLNDFVDDIFTRGTFARDNMIEKLRFSLLENAIKEKISFITTYCYAHDYISTTGFSDPKYVENIEKKLIKLGAVFYAVHLKANNKELIKRVGMNSRKEFRKLKDRKIMRKISILRDWESSAKLKNQIVIDNTNLSPKKVADIIIKEFILNGNKN